MENTQIIAERIKKESKNRGVSVKKILEICNIDKNIVNKLANGKDTGTQTIIKIADCLDCSVDYLLGRVDNQNDTYSISNHNSVVNGTQANVINNSQNNTDSLLEEFLQKFEQLDFDDKLDVMQYVKNKKQEV